MLDLGQLAEASRKCETQHQALELVRRQTAAMVSCFENLSEEDARVNVLGRIAYATGFGMPLPEAAHVMKMFQVEHPYFGGDVSKWPQA